MYLKKTTVLAQSPLDDIGVYMLMSLEAFKTLLDSILRNLI